MRRCVCVISRIGHIDIETKSIDEEAERASFAAVYGGGETKIEI